LRIAPSDARGFVTKEGTQSQDWARSGEDSSGIWRESFWTGDQAKTEGGSGGVTKKGHSRNSQGKSVILDNHGMLVRKGGGNAKGGQGGEGKEAGLNQRKCRKTCYVPS